MGRARRLDALHQGFHARGEFVSGTVGFEDPACGGPLLGQGELRGLASGDLTGRPSPVALGARIAHLVGDLDEDQVVAGGHEPVVGVVLHEERDVEHDPRGAGGPGLVEGGPDPLTNPGVDPALEGLPAGRVGERAGAQGGPVDPTLGIEHLLPEALGDQDRDLGGGQDLA